MRTLGMSGRWAALSRARVGQGCRGGCTVCTALFGFLHVWDRSVGGQDGGATTQEGRARNWARVARVRLDLDGLCCVTTGRGVTGVTPPGQPGWRRGEGGGDGVEANHKRVG